MPSKSSDRLEERGIEVSQELSTMQFNQEEYT